MAGTGVPAPPVISLADIIGLIYRLTFLPRKVVLPRPPYFLIPLLQGFPTIGTVNKPVEDIIHRAGVPLHDARPSVYNLLYFLPLRWCHNPFMAALYNFPFLTGNHT